jgi:hypothetical protein
MYNSYDLPANGIDAVRAALEAAGFRAIIESAAA